MMDAEISPLLVRNEQQSFDSYPSENDIHHDHGDVEVQKSSLNQTTLNMVKMCVGTGVIGIPFAATEGGILFNIFGLGLITMWNAYSVRCLAESRSYITQHKVDNGREEPMNTSTFGLMTWYAFGSSGLHFIDMMLVILMLGIVVAYEDAILGFAADTPITTGSQRSDALVMLILMTPICFLPNYEAIAKISAFGINLIFAIFIVFMGFGFNLYGLEGFRSISMDDLWPHDFSDFSNWFGVAAFGYGVVPFTYSIQESMAEPQELMKATSTSLICVCVLYVVLGDVISIIFVNGIQSDIISELPKDSTLPTFIRLLMIIMVLTTCPLIILPAGELIHDKIIQRKNGELKGRSVFVVRFCIAASCAILSVEVPKFIYVLTFIGCFSVALTSFAYPPLLHLRCLFKFYPVQKRNSMVRVIIMDVIMFCCGILVTGFTSVITFKSMLQQM